MPKDTKAFDAVTKRDGRHLLFGGGCGTPVGRPFSISLLFRKGWSSPVTPPNKRRLAQVLASVGGLQG